jgi:hypothetical protein
MLKPFTAEGRFESGFNEIIDGKRCALFAVRQDQAIGLGLAVAEEPGYHTIPLHWCNGDEFAEMANHADALNHELFGLEPKAAGLIVASTMRPAVPTQPSTDSPKEPAPEWARTVYLEAYTSGDGEGPGYARLEVTPAFIRTLQRLRALCVEHALTQARAAGAPDEWGPGVILEGLRLGYPELVVTPHCFWFRDVPRHYDFYVATASQDLDQFIGAVSGAGEPLYIGIDREDVEEQNASES